MYIDFLFKTRLIEKYINKHIFQHDGIKNVFQKYIYIYIHVYSNSMTLRKYS
jgi:hypothetical protein